MAMNFKRSRSGVDVSLARDKTRRLNSSQLSSLLTKRDFTPETVQMIDAKEPDQKGMSVLVHPAFRFGSPFIGGFS
jgi:hypothetical protein